MHGSHGLTKAFERFLRSFSDEDLQALAEEQVERRPVYRRAIEVAVRIELDRRDLRLDIVRAGPPTRPHRLRTGD